MGRITSETPKHTHKYAITLWSDENFEDGHQTKTFSCENASSPSEILEALKKVARETP